MTGLMGEPLLKKTYRTLSIARLQCLLAYVLWCIRYFKAMIKVIKKKTPIDYFSLDQNNQYLVAL